jgi:hypothetical protein
MIKTEGTLRIRKIRQSRNGAFCIADLNTDFGDFKVKDPLLDQFDEGEYRGTVWISEIYLTQYIAYGKSVTEVRARIHDVQITSEDRNARPVAEQEPDPIDETVGSNAQSRSSPPLSPPSSPADAATPFAEASKPVEQGWSAFKSNQVKPATSAATTSVAGRTVQGDLARLFDAELIDFISKKLQIKLDPTVDRAMLREQASALRGLGYKFDPKPQVWNCSTPE